MKRRVERLVVVLLLLLRVLRVRWGNDQSSWLARPRWVLPAHSRTAVRIRIEEIVQRCRHAAACGAARVVANTPRVPSMSHHDDAARIGSEARDRPAEAGWSAGIAGGLCRRLSTSPSGERDRPRECHTRAIVGGEG